MEDRVESDVLFGRPYGGACILLNNRYVSCVKFVFCAERFVVLQLNSVVLVNLYMPCKAKRQTSSALADISVEDVLDEVSSCLTTLDYEYLVIGGDFNVDLSIENASNREVFDFVTDHDLFVCQYPTTSGLNYTFCSTSMHSSLIDWFLLSKTLENCVTKYDILDREPNCSDHLLVTIDLKCNLDIQAPTKRTNDFDRSRKLIDNGRLRWDKGNLQRYYDLTEQFLQ